MLADLLHWHRREEKPEWWAYYHRVEYESDDDFTDDRECIGGLQPKKKVRDEAKSTVFRYKFEPQDHKFSIGSEPFDPATEKKAGEIVWIDDARGLLDLKRSAKQSAADHPRALIPGTPVPTKVLRNAIAACRRVGRRPRHRRTRCSPRDPRPAAAPAARPARAGQRFVPRGPGSARLRQDVPAARA